MSRNLIAMFVVWCAAAPALAQTQATPANPGAPEAPAADEAVAQSVTGCVNSNETGDLFTLADVKNGTFQLTGVEVPKYVGKRVEAKGTSHLRIVGGLWPTPNIAAQAGAIDPLQTTIAAMPGSGTRGTEPATATAQPVAVLRVERIRTVKGRCP